ncbi:MAG: hypothetical protein JW742_08730, partial [Candidatus Aminicenantes bacterium]|nr:hypothetical protein [Candidatus Aminicenantes bacterium]
MTRETTGMGRRAAVIFVASFVFVVSAIAPARGADSPKALTAADYARAEKFLSYNLSSLVFRASVRPTWLPDERFWYRNALPDKGSEFILVDPKRGRRVPAFDHAAVAAALSASAQQTFDASHLPFTAFEFSPDGKAILFTFQGKR